MAEPAGVAAGPGALLREARERQGMDIAMLAAALKVPPSRLEALEAGRFEDLPDVTFARALAQAVCRALKIDAGPVLAQLPQQRVIGLEKVSNGLNMPFRDRPGRVLPADWAPWRKPVLWTAGALVVGAAAFVLLPPRGTLPAATARAPVAAAASAASVASSDAIAPAPTSATLSAAPTTEVPASATAVEPSPPAGQGAVLVAVQPTWIQAVDGGGQPLVSRLLPAGETFELAGTPPIRIKIGNAAGTRLTWRGQMLDLAPVTVNNVANVELR